MLRFQDMPIEAEDDYSVVEAIKAEMFQENKNIKNTMQTKCR